MERENERSQKALAFEILKTFTESQDDKQKNLHNKCEASFKARPCTKLREHKSFCSAIFEDVKSFNRMKLDIYGNSNRTYEEENIHCAASI